MPLRVPPLMSRRRLTETGYNRSMATVLFKPSGVSIEVRDGTTVFAAAIAAEVAIPSQCGGRCACALCRVRILEGEDRISPIQWQEAEHMGNCFYLTRERLSCQSKVYGDVVVELAEVDTAEKPKSRYIPYSIIRKRERMEQQEELRRAGGRGSPGAGRARPGKRTGTDSTKSTRGAGDATAPRERPEDCEPADRSSASRRRSSARKRRRSKSRNPGSLRPGQTRPPAGVKAKSKGDGSSGGSQDSG